ncbi:TnsA endonuclease N-terminal domain-containing protein [Ralstonia pseudosolanacearum]
MGPTELASFQHGAPLVWPPRLPLRDSRGIPHGGQYVPFKRAVDSKQGVGLEVPHVRWKRRCTLLSLHEFYAAYAFSFDGRIVDAREQYPFYAEDRIARRIEQGERIPVNELATLDFVLTLLVRGQLVYHAVSIKPAARIDEPAVVRRHEREEAFCKRQGWSWESMSESAFNAVDFRNHALLATWLKATRLDDLMPLIPDFSRRVLRSQVSGSTERLLRLVTNRMAIGLNDGYRLFAAAVSLGWIRLYSGRSLDVHLPPSIRRDL